MSEHTNISWCDSTINFWRGCDKVSEGCKNCYITTTIPFRTTGQKHGDPRVHSASAVDQALALNRKPWVCNLCGHGSAEADLSNCPKCNADLAGFHRRRVFSLSLGDWLDPKVPTNWLGEMLNTIRKCYQLEWLLLTKRPELWRQRIDEVCRLWACDGGYDETDEAKTYHWLCQWRGHNPPRNLWFGFSAENQEQLLNRYSVARTIPNVMLWCSAEPLLGPLDLTEILADEEIPISHLLDWIVLGGESGTNARPCHVDWIHLAVQQARAMKIVPFVKQLGKAPLISHDGDDLEVCYSTGLLSLNVKHPKGGDMLEWPEALRIREFPTRLS